MSIDSARSDATAARADEQHAYDNLRRELPDRQSAYSRWRGASNFHRLCEEKVEAAHDQFDRDQAAYAAALVPPAMNGVDRFRDAAGATARAEALAAEPDHNLAPAVDEARRYMLTARADERKAFDAYWAAKTFAERARQRMLWAEANDRLRAADALLDGAIKTDEADALAKHRAGRQEIIAKLMRGEPGCPYCGTPNYHSNGSSISPEVGGGVTQEFGCRECYETWTLRYETKLVGVTLADDDGDEEEDRAVIEAAAPSADREIVRVFTATHSDGRGYAWTEDGVEGPLMEAQTHYEAIGSLMMELSCIGDLEKTGIDLTLVDSVPPEIVARLDGNDDDEGDSQ